MPEHFLVLPLLGVLAHVQAFWECWAHERATRRDHMLQVNGWLIL